MLINNKTTTTAAKAAAPLLPPFSGAPSTNATRWSPTRIATPCPVEGASHLPGGPRHALAWPAARTRMNVRNARVTAPATWQYARPPKYAAAYVLGRLNVPLAHTSAPVPEDSIRPYPYSTQTARV